LIVPISGREEFQPFIQQLKRDLRRLDISSQSDESSNSIGRRYARNDEIGIPFGITVDFQTVQDKTVTIRERDSTKQIRLSISDVPQVLLDLTSGNASWSDKMALYPEFIQQELKE
jgi:glycyl-tRNA synthetase